jgi:hypothetical protein
MILKMAFTNLLQLGSRLLGDKIIDLELAIKSIEQILPMPCSYRETLVTFGGAVVFENGARFTCDERSPLSDKDGYLSLEVLYGLGKDKNSVERKVAQYAGELPPSFVPIGESSGGNLVCVDGSGAVRLWNHESQRDERACRIADSVEIFLSRLAPDNSGNGSTEGVIEQESFIDC